MYTWSFTTYRNGAKDYYWMMKCMAATASFLLVLYDLLLTEHQKNWWNFPLLVDIKTKAQDESVNFSKNRQLKGRRIGMQTQVFWLFKPLAFHYETAIPQIPLTQSEPLQIQLLYLCRFSLNTPQKVQSLIQNSDVGKWMHPTLTLIRPTQFIPLFHLVLFLEKHRWISYVASLWDTKEL